MINWQGVYPALLTQFTEDGKLDLPLFDINMEAQLAAGVDGIILGGSLGEASTLTFVERLGLVQHCVNKYQYRVPIILNIAESSLTEAIRLAESAEEMLANGLMVLPPMQYKATDDEVVNWFEQIADSTSLPIMLYNNPVDYKIEITPTMLDRLLKKDNIQAIKESTRDVTNVTRLKHRFGNRLMVLGGVDTLAMECLLMGADGWVAGLVDAFPRETVAIYRLVRAGRIDEARRIYRWFMPLLELDINPQLVQNIKLAGTYTGISSEHVRPPRLPLHGAERQRVIRIIETQLAIRPELPNYLDL